MSDLDHLKDKTAEELFKMDWYERTVEPEIRPIVKLLRDNGFNTTGSCGHKMFVVIFIWRPNEIGDVCDCLNANGYKNINIDVSVIKAVQYLGLAKITIKERQD